MRKATICVAAVLGLLTLSACESETGPASDPVESEDPQGVAELAETADV